MRWESDVVRLRCESKGYVGWSDYVRSLGCVVRATAIGVACEKDVGAIKGCMACEV